MGDFLARGRRLLIGVIHLPPLPGSPRWNGKFEAILRAAEKDAAAYQKGGADALLVENFGDLPFTKGPVPPETVASMAVAGAAVRSHCGLPLGFNVLRNDGHAALALCAACDGQFLRINVLSGVMVTDQGLIGGDAYLICRLRRQLAPGAKILADIHVKHAAPLAGIEIEGAARDTLDRGLADALIVSGTGTGEAVSVEDLRRVRSECPAAVILVGSGASVANVRGCLDYADGVIVGTSVKVSGKLANPVDPRRVKALRDAMDRNKSPARKRKSSSV